MLLAVAIIGGGLAALKAQSPTVAGLLVLAMLGLILAAVLGAVCLKGQWRYFWLGIALFGSAYFAIAFTPVLPTVRGEIEQPLRAFRDTFWSFALPANAPVPILPETMAWRFDKSTNQRIAGPVWNVAFGATLHCVVNFLFALTGGFIGRWFYVMASRGDSRRHNAPQKRIDSAGGNLESSDGIVPQPPDGAINADERNRIAS